MSLIFLFFLCFFFVPLQEILMNNDHNVICLFINAGLEKQVTSTTIENIIRKVKYRCRGESMHCILQMKGGSYLRTRGGRSHRLIDCLTT